MLYTKLLYIKRHFLYVGFFLYPFGNFFKTEKQQLGFVLQNRSSEKFCKIHRKTSAPESLSWYSSSLEAGNFIKTETPSKVFFCEFRKIFKDTCFVDYLRAAASKKGNINSNNTVKSLPKIRFFCTEELFFLVTLNILAKKLWGHANFRLVY